jgi:hypothetical protein
VEVVVVDAVDCCVAVMDGVKLGAFVPECVTDILGVFDCATDPVTLTDIAGVLEVRGEPVTLLETRAVPETFVLKLGAVLALPVLD